MNTQDAYNQLQNIALSVKPSIVNRADGVSFEGNNGHIRTELNAGRIDCYADWATSNPGSRGKHVRYTWKLNGKRISMQDLACKLRDA